MSEKKILTTPIKAEDLEDIKIGDIIYLNGYIVTCRDVAHRRLINNGRALPVDIDGGASMRVRLFDHLEMINMKWFQSDRQPVCEWKNSKKNLLNKQV